LGILVSLTDDLVQGFEVVLGFRLLKELPTLLALEDHRVLSASVYESF
jgi:hypothetical protein